MNKVEAIAQAMTARENCRKSGNTEWAQTWTARIDTIEASLPSGAGIDCGTTIDRERSKPDCIVLCASFHHMDEHGGYDGWTEHEIRLRPSFVYGVDVSVSGRDRNGIKDYLAEVYDEDAGSEWAYDPQEAGAR